MLELKLIFEDFDNLYKQHKIQMKQGMRYQLVLEDEGDIIGLVSGVLLKNWFELTLIWIKNNYCGRAYGARMLRAMEQDVRQIGVLQIWA